MQIEKLKELEARQAKRTLKAADDRHRNDNILVFVATVWPAQFVCDGPDKVHFGGNIDRRIVPHCIYNLLISHLPFTSLFFK